MRGDNIKCNSLRKQWLGVIQNQKFIHVAIAEWLRKRYLIYGLRSRQVLDERELFRIWLRSFNFVQKEIMKLLDVFNEKNMKFQYLHFKWSLMFGEWMIKTWKRKQGDPVVSFFGSSGERGWWNEIYLK